MGESESCCLSSLLTDSVSNRLLPAERSNNLTNAMQVDVETLTKDRETLSASNTSCRERAPYLLMLHPLYGFRKTTTTKKTPVKRVGCLPGAVCINCVCIKKKIKADVYLVLLSSVCF